MKKIFLFIINIALISSFPGCRKDLLDTSPYGDAASSTMWTTDNMTKLGVAGVYQAMRLGVDQSGASGVELYQLDRLSFVGQTRDADAFMTGTITPGSSFFSNNWKNLFEGVQRADDAIRNIPLKSPSAPDVKARYIAECKFLRAYFYLRLNQMFRGVPVYLEPVTVEQCTKGRSSEDSVWAVVLKDLTDAINEPLLPIKVTGDAGHVTKSAAYALRGKVYMYQKKWDAAIADFRQVMNAGYTLFPDYKALFKEKNETCDEMIFTQQNIGQDGAGSTTQFFCGTRASFGSCWNAYYPSVNVVDLYENADGSRFDWDKAVPGYTTLLPAQREVFFLRDTASEINQAVKDAVRTKLKALTGEAASYYLPSGNEARIKRAYENRDPRLAANVITPYASYTGSQNGVDKTFVVRWPYVTDAGNNNDLRTDTQTLLYYLHRKFVAEGSNETTNRAYGPIDFPIIRYADILLMCAEALNEKGDMQSAIDLVNKVRARAGVASLQNSAASEPTYVSGQSDLRERIRNERRAEFVNEGINLFDEMRWGTWKEKVFDNGGGVKQVWGKNYIDYSWKGDYIYNWAIPKTECEMNTNIIQNNGWIN